MILSMGISFLDVCAGDIFDQLNSSVSEYVENDLSTEQFTKLTRGLAGYIDSVQPNELMNCPDVVKEYIVNEIFQDICLKFKEYLASRN